MSFLSFEIQMPRWALVTGASRGIGKSTAIAFAKSGFNVIVASRTVSWILLFERTLFQKQRYTQEHVSTSVYQMRSF